VLHGHVVHPAAQVKVPPGYSRVAALGLATSDVIVCTGAPRGQRFTGMSPSLN